jgi:hypothetical protein
MSWSETETSVVKSRDFPEARIAVWEFFQPKLFCQRPDQFLTWCVITLGSDVFHRLCKLIHWACFQNLRRLNVIPEVSDMKYIVDTLPVEVPY